MKGDPAIIEVLNDVLTAELTAINQYFIHHKMCENWGYMKLSAKSREEAIEEMQHADSVMERILQQTGAGARGSQIENRNSEAGQHCDPSCCRNTVVRANRENH